MRSKITRTLMLSAVVLTLTVSAPNGFGWAAPAVATAGGSSYPLAGINVLRDTDQLVLYSPSAAQTVSPANQWGAEAVVQASTVTEIHDRQSTGEPGTPIPSGGTVLSGHGAARVWMLSYLQVGSPVLYPGSDGAATPAPTPAPGPTATSSPPPAGNGSATVGGAVHALSGVNILRDADALVAYTGAAGSAAPTNQWGAEAAVTGGQISEIRDQQSTGGAAMPIPAGGFVLSGHGASRSWLLAQAAVGVAASYSPGGAAPPPPAPSPSGSCAAGYVQLTFDDGPDAAVTPQVLDTLRTRGVRATFFVIGYKAAAQPALIRREATEGHRIGNHTWDHPYLTQLSSAQQKNQFQQASQAIVAAGAPQPSVWRPPYEDWNSSVRTVAGSLGMTMMLWSYETDSNDWQGGSPQVIRDQVVANAHDGDIVLLHDRIQNSATALPMILDGLNSKNLCIR